MLDIDDLRIDYGSGPVIDGLKWQAGGPGEVISALLGPSGCGKSTLLRAIAGLEPLAGGRIAFDGRDLAGVEVHRRDFGVVFQDGQLFGGRSVAANIGYGLKVRRWPRARISERVAQMLDAVSLTGFADRRASELSGGQAQRVALARALAPHPRLLLLDEPLAALDLRLRERLATDIADIVRAAGTPTIVVTHDHTEAALMADRISVMRSGDIVQSATPRELWRRPVDEVTARFLGATRILEAEVTDGVADTDLGPVPVEAGDGRVRLGLSAACLLVSEASAGVPAPAAGVPGAPNATVLQVIELPSGPRVRVGTAIGDLDARADEPMQVGDSVSVRIVADRVAVLGG